MIKINLLPHRKKISRSQSKGEQSVLVGIIAVAAVAAAVYFLVHRPKAEALAAQEETNNKIDRDNKKVEQDIKGLGALRAAIQAAEEQRGAIERLNQARSTPAWLLYELSQILTRGGTPSVTDAMARELESNPNRRWQPSWDPKHVWVTELSENKGTFTLTGGAQSDSDITQLALRLQASMFFDDVKPSKAGSAEDSKSGINYYKFVITGTVRY